MKQNFAPFGKSTEHALKSLKISNFGWKKDKFRSLAKDGAAFLSRVKLRQLL
jgi:hypothetical protein